MTNATTVRKFDAWIKFSEGGGGPRTCYIGHSDESAARHLLMDAYPGSRMDGGAERMSFKEAFSEISRMLENGELYITI